MVKLQAAQHLIEKNLAGVAHLMHSDATDDLCPKSRQAKGVAAELGTKQRREYPGREG